VAEITVLLVGSTFRWEFREARAVLERFSRVVPAIDAATAAAVIETDEVAPDVIVVAQAYPGQFSAEAIDHLRRLAPLSPVIGLLGSWCEGEMRTGEPWPGTLRVYWHQWASPTEQELRRLSRGECSSWGLPATATEEEHLLASVAQTPYQPSRQGSILVRSQQFDMQDWLAAACRMRGYRTEWLRAGRSIAAEDATAVIFDASDEIEAELEDLRRLARAVPGVPLIAVLGFPRMEDRGRALEAGAAAVLSKPLLVNDLFWQIDELLGT